MNESVRQQMENKKTLTTSEVSQILGVSKTDVHELCRDKKIEATKCILSTGILWIIPANQFKSHPNWERFIDKKTKQEEKLIQLVDEVFANGSENARKSSDTIEPHTIALTKEEEHLIYAIRESNLSIPQVFSLIENHLDSSLQSLQNVRKKMEETE